MSDSPGEQRASLIWRPTVEPTQSPVPYPNESAGLASHRYTRTSLAHRHCDNQSSSPVHQGASADEHQGQLNRRILTASQSYNSSPRPFVRQASLRGAPGESPPASGQSPSGTGQAAAKPPQLARQHQLASHHSLGPLQPRHDNRAQGDQAASMAPKLVHQQYNSPMNLYSMNNIRKTIEAHSELIAPGVKGINFMKSEAPVNKQSEVLKLIKEEEEEEEEEEARRSHDQHQRSGLPSTSQASSTSQRQQQQRRVQYAAEQSSLNHRSADDTCGRMRSILRQPSARAVSLERHLPSHESQSMSAASPSSGVSRCFECGQLIVGPFARLHDRSIHPHCFNCSTCGTSLKNSGYFTINDKLYCEIHARQVANVMRLNYNFEPNKQAVVGNQQQVSEQHQRDERSQHFSLVGRPPPVARAELQGPGEASKVRPQVAAASHSHQAPLQPPPPLQRPAVSVANSAGAHCAICCSASRQQAPGGTTISTMFSNAQGQQGCEHCKNSCSCQRRSEITWTWRPASHVEHHHQQHQQVAESRQSSILSTRAEQQQANKYESRLQTYSASGNGTSGTRKAPVCCHCRVQIYGPYISAGQSTWCKPCSQTNFVCHSCHRSLLNVGFIEDSQTGHLNCEHCYETHLAPVCSKCHARIRGDCLNALGKRWHPNCFVCGHCRGPFGNSSFYLEDDVPYCERDWNLLFTTKCFSCGYAIEAGDKWIEALGRNYHSDCFRCAGCQVKLEGSTFYCKSGKPYCQMHAR